MIRLERSDAGTKDEVYVPVATIDAVEYNADEKCTVLSITLECGHKPSIYLALPITIAPGLHVECGKCERTARRARLLH